MDHTVNCPLTKSEGKLQSLYNVENNAFNRLKNAATMALGKQRDEQSIKVSRQEATEPNNVLINQSITQKPLSANIELERPEENVVKSRDNL